MAILGGGVGGAGNPVGGSFTGAAEALEIIGDFAFGYSGEVSCGDDPTNLLNATTGNYIFVGEFTPYYYTEGETDDMIFELNLNGTTIIKLTLSDATVPPQSGGVPVIIPPYTELQVTSNRRLSGTARNVGATLIGRIYRTRD
mgnify:CR=1 FL=1